MDKKLVEYENGDRVIWDGHIRIEYHQTQIVREISLTKATVAELKQLKLDPHNDSLLAEIEKR